MNLYLTRQWITDSEISDDEDVELDAESLYERVAALKDMIPPSARRTISFSGKALWVISTSAFLLGVPFALAYAEEEQYIQMEREQGMIKGANEVCLDI
jgi:import receptor subunit TOM22